VIPCEEPPKDVVATAAAVWVTAAVSIFRCVSSTSYRTPVGERGAVLQPVSATLAARRRVLHRTKFEQILAGTAIHYESLSPTTDSKCRGRRYLSDHCPILGTCGGMSS
jgi:hypothetical protein